MTHKRNLKTAERQNKGKQQLKNTISSGPMNLQDFQGVLRKKGENRGETTVNKRDKKGGGNRVNQGRKR